jgi:sugar phosphate isomerase/epimerase
LKTVARRSFLATLGTGLAAPALLRAQSRSKRLPLCFSTLGCPAWSWRRILDEADRLGYAAIEVRFIEYDPNLPSRPEFTGTRLQESRRDLDALGIKLVNLGSPVRLHEKEPSTRSKHLDDGRRFIDLARGLDVPYVRVFPDKLPPAEAVDDVLARIVEGGRELAAHARGSGVTVLLESHGDLTRSDLLEPVLEGVESDRFALLWDAHHTVAAGKEAPAVTWERLGRWVRHVHLKDSVPAGKERRYVLTGDGEVPVREQVRLLVAGGYSGYYSFEWELCGHPEIGEPEVAFPHYVKVMGEYLAAAGYKA